MHLYHRIDSCRSSTMTLNNLNKLNKHTHTGPIALLGLVWWSVTIRSCIGFFLTLKQWLAGLLASDCTFRLARYPYNWSWLITKVFLKCWLPGLARAGDQCRYGRCGADITWATGEWSVRRRPTEAGRWTCGTAGRRRGALHLVLGTRLPARLPSSAHRPPSTRQRYRVPTINNHRAIAVPSVTRCRCCRRRRRGLRCAGGVRQ